MSCPEFANSSNTGGISFNAKLVYSSTRYPSTQGDTRPRDETFPGQFGGSAGCAGLLRSAGLLNSAELPSSADLLNSAKSLDLREVANSAARSRKENSAECDFWILPTRLIAEFGRFRQSHSIPHFSKVQHAGGTQQSGEPRRKQARQIAKPPNFPKLASSADFGDLVESNIGNP